MTIRIFCDYVMRKLVLTILSKGVDLTGLLGGYWGSEGRKSLSGVPGCSPGRGSGRLKLKLCKTTQFCVKIQQTGTRVNILNDIISRIWGTLPWMSPLRKYIGDMSPCPIKINAPDFNYFNHFSSV